MIEKLQKSIQKFDADLCKPGLDAQQIVKLSKDRTSATDALEQAELDWLEQSDEYETRLNS